MSQSQHEPAPRVIIEDDRTSTSPEALRRAFLDQVQFARARALRRATPHDRYIAWALLVRDRVVQRWIATHDAYRARDAKFVAYLSAEFLMGRLLRTNLVNLELLDEARAIARDLGVDLDRLFEEEPDAGLGNGGLGRLAACFLDSMATLGLPAFGYGIRYEFGIFRQAIHNGYQVEHPDEWLRFGNPWEFERPEHSVPVRFYGRVERHIDSKGHVQVRWVDTQNVLGVPYDTPILGYGRGNVNTLRLWSARSTEEFDLDVFNAGDYEKAVYDKTRSETISKVLYPNDSVQVGRELRLKQQYFFVACSVGDIVRRFLRHHDNFDLFPQKVAIQLNDTHPSVTIPELMRVLVDDHHLPWERAWNITQATCAYTNHTLMSEALERWSVELFERLLPRHLEIIYEINTRFLRSVQIHFPGDNDRLRRMSLIEETSGRNVRMANLSVVGAHSINGVSELHTKLLRADVLRDFAEMYPERFNNKTNGVTPRRWLLECNPGLASLLDDKIGKGWVTDLDRLADFRAFADDATVQGRMAEIKAASKKNLTRYLAETQKLTLNPESIFDTQIKRIHEYKRQLLNILSVAGLYLRHRRSGLDIPPVTFLFGGKSAPGYVNAKLIIRLIHGVAEVVNETPGSSPLAVHFVPDYRVSLAERLIPATEISEQISTAGFEASGTGNMKFALNGALTLGTLDGANIEIRESVGEDAFFLFGLTAEEVQARKASYRPGELLRDNPELAEVLELIRGGFFSPEDKSLFRAFVDQLIARDPYMVIADFPAYQQARLRALGAYRDGARWQHMAIRNVAGSGPFSSDRTIRQYASEIWGIEPVDVATPIYSPESLFSRQVKATAHTGLLRGRDPLRARRLTQLAAILHPGRMSMAASFADLLSVDRGNRNVIRLAWDRLHYLPGGKALFSKLIGRAAPYTGTIDARVVEVSARRARVLLEDRPGVRNHLRCVHAIALVNLAELAGNVAVAYALPDDARFIVAGLSIEYLKKARGTIEATTELDVTLTSERREIQVPVSLRNQAGEEVARATLRTLIGPKK